MKFVHDNFLPNGRLRKLQFAVEASNMGFNVVGVATNNCVVLAAENEKSTPLAMAKKSDKIVRVDEQIGCALSGAIIDGHRLIHLTRIKCQEHWFDYNEFMPLESTIDYTSSLVMPSVDLENHKIPESRPFSVVFLFGGFDGEDPQLWHLGPSGNYERFACMAIGKGRQAAKKFLDENYHHRMEVQDAIKLCLLSIQRATKVPLTPADIEVMCMTKDNKECVKISEMDLNTIIH